MIVPTHTVTVLKYNIKMYYLITLKIHDSIIKHFKLTSVNLSIYITMEPLLSKSPFPDFWVIRI